MRPKDTIAISINGTPQQNTAKVIAMLGGIEKFIQPEDIVILKPNLQWWNQGRTNLASVKGFIDLVLGIKGFNGEVLICENIHFMDESLENKEKDNIRGWTHLSDINGDIDGINHSMNSLVESYHNIGFKNVNKVHWRDGGEKHDVWGNGQAGGIIKHPGEGDGYIWSGDDYIYEAFFGLKKWKVKMSYPVFTSPFSGIGVDFKNGSFEKMPDGSVRYLPERPVKFINFSVLNDHGRDTGITGAVKNYMGITDMSCGYWGKTPKGYSNIHSCGSGRFPIKHAMAAPIAHFMKNIRMADLNIMTAEWVGWGSRTDVSKATRKKMILAGTNPVALDYYGARNIVFPLSKNNQCHNPDNPDSSIAKYISLVQSVLGKPMVKENDFIINEFDFNETAKN